MFQYEDIQKLNPLELNVYEYVISHKSEITKMTIRELAKIIGVSTSTVLRFCTKVGLNGFSELKFYVKQNLQGQPKYVPHTSIVDTVNEFFYRADDQQLTSSIQSAAKLIVRTKLTVFLGIGSSNYFSQYGARILANLGIYTLTINDPFQPKPNALIDPSQVTLIVLSVSGETEQTLTHAQFYKEQGASLIAITNTTKSTLAHIADVNITYNVLEVRDGSLNLTTQVPLVFILEMLMNEVQEALNKQNGD
ncbi:MurR/RpiR family transcriptional regulator [Agrilactobacillus fermenti]|uniref:MurR/RpiR family transcriptional regulator n=1 Tax=Agrilactobacillus fermenti TaxID=2586909 RepID=UPI001E2E49E7|nr:MurR/RpiR family transcriptional regulator [Agrilactobacillus fermenti]MCD2257507.1 MurR/RpiR family transcriptional regulator [Agrilactobacillus fermenti]